MVRELMHDPIFLARKSEEATKEDLDAAQDLLDTLTFHKEGCLSLLGSPRSCRRFRKIKVKYQNLQMQVRIKAFTGWTAQIIQHEVDHCNGVLI